MGSSYDWCVYMLWSSKLDVYYIGITTDLPRRLKQHNEGKGAKFTRGKGPWVVAAYRPFEKKGEALRVEKRLKKLNHDSKALVV